jgi:hypothetical protein
MSRDIPINNIRMPFTVLAGRSVDTECSWVIILSHVRYESDITLIAPLATARSVEHAPPAGSALHSPQIRET